VDTSASDRIRRPTLGVKDAHPCLWGLIPRLRRRRVCIGRSGESILTYLTHPMTKTTSGFANAKVFVVKNTDRSRLDSRQAGHVEEGVRKYVAALDGPL
jgi:hypothetical protein